MTLAESMEILDYIQSKAGKNANVIWGANKNELLDDELELIVIATGFKPTEDGKTGSFQPIAKRGERGKWIPPKNPFDKRGTAAEKPEGNDIIIVTENTRYRNIDRIINEPSYIRRRFKIQNDTSGGSKVKMKDESPKKNGPGDKSLFGD